jgi:hypothetical protein
MASSYDKIGESFVRSSHWKALAEKFVSNARALSQTTYDFASRTDYYDDNNHVVNPVFSITFGSNAFAANDEVLTSSDFKFPAEKFLPDSELNEIVESLFGRPGYPTYNCKKDKALKKWPEFARKKLLADHADEVREYLRDVSSQVTHLLSTEEFVAAKKRHYERLVINDIKKVVLKFHKRVGPEVLKEALDEVVTHAIMEGSFFLILLKTLCCAVIV